MAEGIQLEEFGGDIPSASVSGLTGQGLPELVEVISAVAEIQDLRAEQEGPAYGHVLESNVHKGLGYGSLYTKEMSWRLNLPQVCSNSLGAERIFKERNANNQRDESWQNPLDGRFERGVCHNGSTWNGSNCLRLEDPSEGWG